MTGWCLICGTECSAITVDGRGFCEHHSWVYVNWTPPKPKRTILSVTVGGRDAAIAAMRDKHTRGTSETSDETEEETP